MGLLDWLVAKALPITPRRIVKIVAQRYIAGETVEDAMRTVERLNGEGALGTVDALGEFVKSRDVALHETARAIEVVEEIRRRNLGSGVSVKLTSLGLDIDPTFCRENLRRVLSRAAEQDVFVRIDMENSPYTDETLKIAREMWNEFPGNVGVVLQAYLRRTLDDIRALAPTGMSFRLCKGIYVEPEEIAYKGREEVQQNYLRCLGEIFDHGCYVGIATHDDVLIDGARKLIADRGIPSGAYEFQMLLGVRDAKRRELIAEGRKMRVYIPFGEDWYGYSVRRLKENPSVAGHVFKAIFTGD